ncbi:pyridine nucleotide-disulfide oxidoreductase-domain-containing protein [Boeremia exigua]|uniref:pyridine nucleotide-disulfide oxidoreductase-domain-containing protein n=1 Tax=Boeremia exigua TaxID=749465 RepID=UPI001E8D125C|nr:pyridine nucleotide-disulfide oxidoreductase-domain-containing protein [Boeremia exigua]KAH6613069.1 pyridine nucleotide-disulfide oxidoreductase-domain-containing protein [Boeremia exigua]
MQSYLISDTKATVAIVDRYSRPGGHWTIAYPFVTLHQPSLCYGVNSRKLGDEKLDRVGLNKGLAEMATGDEIVAYYGKVMNSTLLPSGRVTYYPLHNYTSDGQFQSVATGKMFQVGPNTRIVDSTYMKVRVPAMGPPQYEVADKVSLITPNDLATIKRPYGAYTIVGAGKTAADTCLWMLAQGIDPKDISWIMPRDSWFLERSIAQPPEATLNPEQQIAERKEATMKATTSDDMFHRLETYGHVLRIDKNVEPTMFRHAYLSSAEMDQLKRVKNIIRQGRMARIDPDKVTLEQGAYTPVPDTLFINCTALGLSDQPVIPIFNGRYITLQVVKFNQPVFSAALVAHIEATYDNDDDKNYFCEPVPYCFKPKDYVATFLPNVRNRMRWTEVSELNAWCEKARLDMGILGLPPSNPETTEYSDPELMDKLRGVYEKFNEIAKADAIAVA